MTRAAAFAALRPFAPAGGIPAPDVPVLDAMLDRWGIARIAPKDMALKDPTAFYAHVRAGKLLGPILSPSEVEGCVVLLDACGKAGWPIGFTAYALATAYHETAGTMQPIKEMGGETYFTRMYDIKGARPDKARELGNMTAGDGARYCGRGYVQLTGRTNYARASHVVGADLLAQPDLAMRPLIAATIMVTGMRDGWFTGRDLDDDIPRDRVGTLDQFTRSRDIINGTDKAAKIAAEAAAFQDALVAGGWS